MVFCILELICMANFFAVPKKHMGMLRYIKLRQWKVVFKIEEERTRIIRSLTRYKMALKNQEEDLKKLLPNLEVDSKEEKALELKHDNYFRLSPDKSFELNFNGYHNLKFDNTFKMYVETQLKLVNMLPAIVDEHLALLRSGDDLDHAVKSLEHAVYMVKKDVYKDMDEWHTLLNHMDVDRLVEISKNPKGPGDLIVKDLLWMKSYEENLKDEK